MAEDNKTPDWIEMLSSEIAFTIEWKAPAYVEWHYSKADENGWGVDLIELYPALAACRRERRTGRSRREMGSKSWKIAVKAV